MWRQINQLPTSLGQEMWLKYSHKAIPTERKSGKPRVALCPPRGSGFFGELPFNIRHYPQRWKVSHRLGSDILSVYNTGFIIIKAPPNQ